MERKPALMGITPFLDDILAALAGLQRENFRFTVHSPTPRREIEDALEPRPSRVRGFALAGGIGGILLGLGLSVYTVVQWNFVVQGRPPVPFVPFVVVAFEFCILLGVLTNLAGMLFLARLPQRKLPAYYDPRFTEDRFAVVVPYAVGQKGRILSILQRSGMTEIREVEA